MSWIPAQRAFDAGHDNRALRLLTDGMWGPPVYDAMPPARREVALRNVAAMKLLVRAADRLPDLPREAVSRLTMPVLLVRGAWASALHQRGLEELAALLPNSRQAVIANAGHASAAENPKAFNAAVAAFVRMR